MEESVRHTREEKRFLEEPYFTDLPWPKQSWLIEELEMQLEAVQKEPLLGTIMVLSSAITLAAMLVLHHVDFLHVALLASALIALWSFAEAAADRRLLRKQNPVFLQELRESGIRISFKTAESELSPSEEQNDRSVEEVSKMVKEIVERTRRQQKEER